MVKFATAIIVLTLTVSGCAGWGSGKVDLDDLSDRVEALEEIIVLHQNMLVEMFNFLEAAEVHCEELREKETI